MNGRAWLVTSWTGRGFLGAVVLKGLVSAALWATGGTVALDNADRIVNLALIVLASIAIVELTLAVRARLRFCCSLPSRCWRFCWCFLTSAHIWFATGWLG